MLTELHASLQDAVRMAFLHSSRPHGRIQKALKTAADVRFLGHDGTGTNVTILHFEVPTFGSAAPTFFEQPLLWDKGPREDETAFEMFGAALTDVAARRTDSSRFDPPLLRRIGRYGATLKRGVQRVALFDTRADAAHIDKDVVEAAAHLASVTPHSQRVRVAGRLDLMGASQSVLKIEVKAGEFVTVVWDADEPIEDHHELFNKDVVVEGLAVFRPSGTLLRIDANIIGPATPKEDFFRQVPRATVARDYQKAVRLRPHEPSAYLQLRGCLAEDADESEEDFKAAIATLR